MFLCVQCEPKEHTIVTEIPNGMELSVERHNHVEEAHENEHSDVDNVSELHQIVEVGQQGEEHQISAHVDILEAELEPQATLKEFLVIIHREDLLPCL